MSRLPIVLVVDPVSESRLSLWRALSRSFGVLEAADADGARNWLRWRLGIDALVVQAELPDATGGELVRGLTAEAFPAAARSVIVSRPVDTDAVLRSLAAWLVPPSVRRASSHRQRGRADGYDTDSIRGMTGR